jgi:hypothetical protein
MKGSNARKTIAGPAGEISQSSLFKNETFAASNESLGNEARNANRLDNLCVSDFSI